MRVVKWTDQSGDHQCTLDEAVKAQRDACISARGHDPYGTNADAFADFLAVHWARVEEI